MTWLRVVPLLAILLVSGCGESDVPAKTEFTEEMKKKVEAENKQHLDEWGNKAR